MKNEINEDVLNNLVVIKREGKRVSFDGTKVAVAIKKGFDSIEGNSYNEDDINKVYNKVIADISSGIYEKIKIEEIQDLIEKELQNCGYNDVYESFSEYREARAHSREIFLDEKRKHKFLKALEKIGLNTKDSGDQFVNKKATDSISEYGKTVSEEFATSYLMKKKFADLHENGDIYIKKISFYPMGSTANCQMDIEKLFKDGFSTENCQMRTPKSIMSYAMLTVIAVAQNQKDQSGEQSIPAFDYYMAPGVLQTFRKEFRQTIYDILEYTDYDKFIALNGIDREIDKLSTIDFNIEDFYRFTRDSEELQRMFRIVYAKALKKTEIAVYQAMEAFVHDINSMTSGNRITTVNIGTDTSAEGRMITKNLLSAIKNGLGSHAQPKSPVVVFKVKSGVNYKEKDKNNDLFNKAVELSAQSENIAFSFIDAQYNAQFYKEGDFNTEVAYFADGARIMDNFVDKEKAVAAGRGTLSTTVINLPRIALKSGNNKKEFFEELDRKMTMIKDQMLERFEIQSNKKVLNFPFLMGQNVWIDSERIEEDNKVKKHLKHGNMRITFLGLNEALILMTGKGHDESRNSQELGLSIVAELRKKVDEYSEKYGLNFVLAGEESEHVAKEFLDIDRAIFGKIKNVTDKEMYTSSFNIPDQKDLDKKLKIEAPYHEYTNGGHVMTIDTVKSDSEKAIEEMHEFIKEAYKNEVGLLEVRHSK